MGLMAFAKIFIEGNVLVIPCLPLSKGFGQGSFLALILSLSLDFQWKGGFDLTVEFDVFLCFQEKWLIVLKVTIWLIQLLMLC